MAQTGLDSLDVGAVGHEQAGRVAAQVMMTEARGKVLDLAAGFPHRTLYCLLGELTTVLPSQQRS
jgi:hypothetical protein